MTTRFGKFVVLFIALLCLVLCGGAMADTLELPAAVTVIEEEAFYGDTSLDKVVLPEGVTTIGPRAFAGSSLREINLPSSIIHIADTAFANTSGVSFTAQKGTYAYDWAVDHGYAVTASSVWDATGTAIAAAGNQDYLSGTLIDEANYDNLLLLRGNGGWYRLTAPAGGYFVISGLNTNSTDAYFCMWNADHKSISNNKFAAKSAEPISYNTWPVAKGEAVYFWVANSSWTRYADYVKTVISFVNTIEAPVQSAPKGSEKQLTVNWGSVTGAVSYNIYYNTKNDISTAKEIIGVSGNSYTITGLSDGTTYFTWVKAVSTDYVSGASNVKNVITYPVSPIVSVSAFGNNISVYWGEVTGASYYRVLIGTSSTMSQATKMVDNYTNTTYTITGLNYNTSYYVWVAACNSSGGYVRWVKTSTQKFGITEISPWSDTTVSVGDQIAWSIITNSSSNEITYNYTLRCDGSIVDQVSNSTNFVYRYAPSKAGNYTLEVQAKDDQGNTATATSGVIKCAVPALTISSVECLTATPRVGEEVTWRTEVTGGVAPYTYEYFVETIANGIDDFVETSSSNIYRCVPHTLLLQGTCQCRLTVTVIDAVGSKAKYTCDKLTLQNAELYLKYSDYYATTNLTDIDAISDLGDEFTIDVLAEGSWSVNSTASWLTVAPTFGTGNGTITVNVNRNYGAARESLFKITSGTQSATVAVSQYPVLPSSTTIITPVYSNSIIAPTMLATLPDSIFVQWEYEPQVKTYEVRIRDCGTGTTIASSDNLKYGISQYTFSNLSLENNKLYEIVVERVKIIGGNNGRRSISTVYFMQEKEESYILLDSDSREFSGEEDYAYINVRSSGDWVVVSDANWLWVSDTVEVMDTQQLEQLNETPDDYRYVYGRGFDDFLLYASYNDTNAKRTGTVTIYCGSVSRTITIKQQKYCVLSEITSPVLGTRTSTVNIKPGSLALKWSAAQGGTGYYKIKLDKHSENGWKNVVTSSKSTALSYTISKDNIEEGYDYRLTLYTYITSTGSETKTYYFHVSRQNELTVNLTTSGTATVGDSVGIRVDASASGGSGEYQYTFNLMQGETVVNRSIGWDKQSYWTFPLPKTGDYYVRVYVRDTDGTMIYQDSNAVQAKENTVDYVLLDGLSTELTLSMDASSQTESLNIISSGSWTYSKDAAWLTVSASGARNSKLTISATANSANSVRTGHITITCGSATAKLTISQNGGGSILLSNSTLDFGSGASNQSVKITSSANWTASKTDDWITLSPTSGASGASVSISVKKYTGVGMRTGVVKVTAGGQVKVITVNQMGTADGAVSNVQNIRGTIQTGEQTDIWVTVTNGTRVRMTIDGKYVTDEYVVDDMSVAYVRYAFSASGERRVSFSVYSNGVWNDDSTVYTVNVVAPNGVIDVPNVKSNQAVYSPSSTPSITWTDKGKANNYTAYIYRNGQLINTASQKGKSLIVSSSDTALAGHYVVSIMASGIGYDQASGTAEFDVQWEGYLQRLSANVYKNLSLSDEQQQIKFGTKYTIAEEYSAGDLQIGKIKSGDVVLGYINLGYMSTEYWHPCLKDGVYVHDYYTSYEKDHPHKAFVKCSVCEEWKYTGQNATNAGQTEATCCLCGNHQYTIQYGATHPHYAVKTCTRSGCGYTTTDTSKQQNNYAGCCICNGHKWGTDGFCTVCGLFDAGYIANSNVKIDETQVQIQSDEYIAYCSSFIDDTDLYNELCSWINLGGDHGNYKNSGYLLLEATQNALETKNIEANSGWWQAKKAVWGISSLGVSTVMNLIKTAAGNSDRVKQYSEILENSYVTYMATSLEKTQNFMKPYDNMIKTIKQGDKHITALLDAYCEEKKVAADFAGWKSDDIYELYLFSLEHDEYFDESSYADLTKLAKWIEHYENAKVYVDGVFLLCDGTKLAIDVETTYFNKEAFLMCLISASDDMIDSLVRMKVYANRDMQIAIDRFIKDFRAAVSGCIKSYALSSTMQSKWTDISKFGIDCAKFFDESFLGGKMPTSVWGILSKVVKGGEVFKSASALMTASQVGMDVIFDTSKIQSSIETIDSALALKEDMKSVFWIDYERFRKNRSKENAIALITDLHWYKSFAIAGEKKAQSFYDDRIEDMYQKESTHNFWFTDIREIDSKQYEIDLEYVRRKEAIQLTVDCNMNIIDSFYIPD